MKSYTAKIPAKAILFGEHAVVYPGYGAILTPVLSLNCTATATAPKKGGVLAKDLTRNFKWQGSWKELSKIYTQAKTDYARFSKLGNFDLLAKYKRSDSYFKLCLAIAHSFTKGHSLKPVQITTTSTIPPSGFGSSAAFAAAVIKSFLTYQRTHLTMADLFKLVLEAERFQHGNPSGADVAAVVYACPIYFEKTSQGSGKIVRLPLNTFTKRWLGKLRLIDTGARSAATGDLVK